MKIYVSGSLNANEYCGDRELNKKTMNKATEALRKRYTAHIFVNPLEIKPLCMSLECGDQDEHSWQCWMRGDIVELMNCDAIAMLPGWEYSKGAKVEKQLANQLGYSLYFIELGINVLWEAVYNDKGLSSS